ncbi:pyridoxamine 5'-phosphate oxidase family protein [Frigidibacter sp. MR17.14]|uniref:pyridoxamine 5'-phosphate oxidase family protein n=1 Tax=Frigidibacter sp. MR17.14 TaxID=3126509 RepID=UPI003012CBC8
MSHRSDLAEDPRGTLFALLKDVPAGMLSIDGSADHPQPMTHVADATHGELWFLTSRQTDLVRAVGQGGRAKFTVIADDQCLHASLAGAIVQSVDAAHLDRLWTTAAAPWFPEGRDDPDLIALRMTLSEAMVWASTTSSLRYGFEMLRGAVDGEHAPDIATQVLIPFNG